MPFKWNVPLQIQPTYLSSASYKTFQQKHKCSQAQILETLSPSFVLLLLHLFL